MPVYFIQAGDDGPIKIGWAASVARRRSQLQVQSYLKLTVRAMIDAGKEVEKQLHDRFKGHLIRGEWFEPAGEILDKIARHALSAGAGKAVNEPKKRGPEKRYPVRLNVVTTHEQCQAIEAYAKRHGLRWGEAVRRQARNRQ